MNTSVVGAMGVRTAHQVDPKAQLIVSTSHSALDSGYASGEDSAILDSMSLGSEAEPSELKGLTTDSDVLSAPRLLDSAGGLVERPLGGLEQAVLLGWAQQVKKGTSADELQVCDSTCYSCMQTPWITCNLYGSLTYTSLHVFQHGSYMSFLCAWQDGMFFCCCLVEVQHVECTCCLLASRLGHTLGSTHTMRD